MEASLRRKILLASRVTPILLIIVSSLLMAIYVPAYKEDWLAAPTEQSTRSRKGHLKGTETSSSSKDTSHIISLQTTSEALVDMNGSYVCRKVNQTASWLIFGRLPFGALTASSMWGNRHDHGPQCSRLNVQQLQKCDDCRRKIFRRMSLCTWHYDTCSVPPYDGCIAFAWAAGTVVEPWIQADLEEVFRIEKIATAGRGDLNDRERIVHEQRVLSYKLASLLPDGRIELYIENSTVRVFSVDSKSRTMDIQNVSSMLIGRFIRLYVMSYREYPSLRWDLFGSRC